MVANVSPLLQPFRLGDLTLPNRVVMAPLTRNRATHGSDVPSDLAATYYRQRASAGLIVSEGTQISQQGQGYVWTPGIYTDAQVEGWRRATDAVHRGGRPHLRPALARRPHFARFAAAERRRAGRALGDPRQHPHLHRKRLRRSLRAARARDGGDRRHRRRFRQRRRQRQARRLRRRRAARRQRLSRRPVPARRRQQAHRRLRRLGREPRPLRARSRRRGDQGMARLAWAIVSGPVGFALTNST